MKEVIFSDMDTLMNSKEGLMTIFAIGMSCLLAASRKNAEDSRCAEDHSKDADNKSVDDCSRLAKSDENTNHRGDLLESEDAMMNEDLKEDKTRMLANESMKKAEMMNGFSYGDKRERNGWRVNEDGALVSCDEEDVLKCVDTWRSTINAVEFVLPYEEVSVVKMSLMVEHGLVNSCGGQQGKFSEKLNGSVGLWEDLHIVEFERDGTIYLSSILQNYIFDPGGWRTSAHWSMT